MLRELEELLTKVRDVRMAIASSFVGRKTKAAMSAASR